MAFAPKIDFSGLSAKFATQLLIRDDSINASDSEYKPVGQCGDFIELEHYGFNATPSNNFAVTKDITAAEGDVKIGAIIEATTIENGAHKFALGSISISTSGGSAPTLSASSQLVEDDATNANSSYYAVPAFTLKKRNCAQDIFGAFEFSGPIELTNCDHEIGATVDPTTVAGNIVASDISEGQIVVTATFLNKGNSSDSISVSPRTGWTMNEVVSPTNPETSKKTFVYTFTMLLKRVDPAE